MFTKIDAAGLGLSIRAVTEDEKGRIYVATSEGVGYVGENDKLSPVTSEALLQMSAEKVVVDSLDQLWVLLSSGEVAVVRDGKVVKQLSPDKEQYGSYTSLYADSDGTIWMGTEDGVVLCFQTKKKEIIQQNAIVIEGLTQINSFYRDNEERLWICADNQIGYMEEALQFVPLDNCRISNSIECMIQDYEGTYWAVSSRQGVLKMSNSKFFNLGEASNLPMETVNSTQEVWGNLYIASDAGLTVRSVLERNDGSMAVATGGGVDILKEGVVTGHYGTEEGVSNPVILSMCEDESGRLYLGSDGNGIYIVDTKAETVELIRPADGLTTGIILRMALDPEGRGIWISSGNQVDFYDFESGKCGPVSNLTPFQSNVFDFHFLKDGKMLILCAKGMALVDISNFTGLDGDQGKFPVEYYERNAGLSATVTANSWSGLSEDDTLYLSLNPGVNVIDLNAITRNTYAPRVAVSHIQVDDKEPEGKNITVPADATRIIIDFAVPSYVEQDRLKVTYQMEGFDPEPITISWKDSFSVSYTNLAGGDYVFRVSAKNGDGVFSERPAFATIEKSRKLRESPAAITSGNH